jgi:bacillolysin
VNTSRVKERCRKPLGTSPCHLALRLTIWLAVGLPLALAAQGVSAQADQALQGLEQLSGAPLRTTRSELTGLATFIGAERNRPIPAPAAFNAKPEDRALTFLTAHGAAFGLKATPDLRVKRVQSSDEVGMDHVRFQQLHHGIPIAAAEIIVHLQGPNVLAVNAKTLADLDRVATVPAIQSAEASRVVRELLAKHLALTNALLTEPALEILNRGLLDRTRGPTRLAWFIEATRADSRRFFWVDAQTGKVLLHFNQFAHALDRRIYTANCTSSLPGSLVRLEGGPPTGDADADNAYTFAGDTYNFYWAEFGRDSYDGAGAPLISTVHWTPVSGQCNYPNAGWNGEQMVYGDDYASADDVVAHELTHAVTEHSANLFYYMQSGALNESYSDIFGETVDLINGRGTDTPEVRWLLGEDLPIGAIRNMMNPTMFGNPGKMSDPEFTCEDPGGDGGGVHSNSGVPNHAYALMVDGGAYNGHTITGIGLTKAAHIEYRALTTYLISGSDFLDNYNALYQSCNDLIGTYGITASDLVQVQNALLAVEMTNRWPCTPLQPLVPDLCGPGQVVSNLFFDDLEITSSGHWSTARLSGAYNHWVGGAGDSGLYFTNFAASGRYNFWGDDLSTAGNSAVQMRVDVAIPQGDVRMQFNHAYGFENYLTTCYDGAVLECSTNSGSTWFDAGSLITAGATYGGTITSGFGNPLAGRSGFVRDSYGYTASQLTLTNLAGRNVRFRFRIGTDSSVGDYGWFIDDVRIYQVITPNQPPRLANIEINPLYYTEYQPATLITATLTVSDPDSEILTSATVSIAANYDLGRDVLSMTASPPAGITTNYDVAQGVLTLSGASSVTNYEAALRTVTYQNTSGNPSTLTRVVAFAVKDETDLISKRATLL